VGRTSASGTTPDRWGRSELDADVQPEQALVRARVQKHVDELARLIAEVRQARERLSDLIATIKSERVGWDEREQRWERWRSQLQNPPRKPSRRDVH
jgi:hypothetical protein